MKLLNGDGQFLLGMLAETSVDELLKMHWLDYELCLLR